MAKNKAKKSEKKSCWDNFLRSGPQGRIPSITEKDQYHQTFLQRMVQASSIHNKSLALLNEELTSLTLAERDVLLNTPDSKGISPLGQALLVDNLSTAQIFLSWGAKLSQALPNQQWLPVVLNCLDTEAICDFLTATKAAIPMAIDNINPLENNLFASVIKGHNSLLFKDMIRVGIDPNRFCTAEDNLLNLALQHNLTIVISELLAHLDSDSVNTVDARGISPLMLAAEQGNLSVVSQILALHGGADTTNVHGETALHRVCGLSLGRFTEDHHQIAQQLLDAMSIPDMTDTHGNNPAMTAALAGNDRLCNLCLNHCDIFTCNKAGQHLLFLTVYTRCLESCKTLINLGRNQADNPFFLHEKACPTPELLRKHILHNFPVLSPETDPAIPLQNLSPLSLGIVTSVFRFLPIEQNTHNMIDLLVDHHVMDTCFEDDPLFWTVYTQQNHLTSLLISYGIPLSSLTLSSCPVGKKEEQNYTQPLTINREHLIRVSCVDTLFTQGNIQKAIQQARQVHASLFRMNWAQQYWEELGDHFILLQLEYPIDHTATEKIFHTIQKNQLSPYLLLDEHTIHPLQVRLKICLQELLRKITHHKIQTRCNQTQQEVLLQCGFNWHNPDLYQNIHLNQQVDKTLRANLPNQLTHLHLTREADYQSLSQQWQQHLATLQTHIHSSKGKSGESDIDETDREQDIDGKNIRDHFLDVLHSTVSQCFINNHHNPYAITQQLLLLHFSPCHITRLKSLIDINNIITLTKAPSWMNTLGLNLLFSPPKNSLYARNLRMIGIYLPEPQGPFYLDECEQNTLTADQLANLVLELVSHLIREQHTTFAQEVFNSLLAALLDCPTFFTEDNPITIWLQLGAFHKRHAWFYGSTLGKIFSHLQQLSSQQASSELIEEALSLCAPHITTELLAKLLQQPDQIAWLVQRSSLLSLKKSNTPVFALLQALRMNTQNLNHSLANQLNLAQKQRQKRLQISNRENHQKLAQQETEIRTLRQELHKQKQACISVQQDHDLIREKHQRNTKELQALTTHTKALENQLEESTSAYTQTKQTLQDQEQTQKILQTKLDSAMLTHQQQEQALLSQSKQSLDLQKRLQEVEETQASLKKENKQQQRQIKEQATAYNEAITHSETLKKKLTETEETLQQAAYTLKLVNQKNKEQKTALTQSSSKLEDTQSQYVEAQKHSQQLQNRVEQLAKKETDMLTQLAKLTDINHTLTIQLAAYLPPTALNIFHEPNPRELPFANTMPHLLGILEPYCISLFWRGTSAREVLRSQHTNNDKLIEIFSVFQEDIDWTMVSTDSISTIKDELTEKGWICDTDLKNHKLRVTATDSTLYYDIKVFAHGDTSNDYPDSISLLWDVPSKNWIFTSAQLSPAQHKFLQGLIPLNNRDTFTLCSLFWALHLGVKHIACQSPFTTVQSLIQQSILRPQKGTIAKNQAIIDILHKFTDTPYWSATLTTLLHIPFFFADANKLPSEAPKASPIIRLLLPDDAIIPPGIDWTQSSHFHTVATPSELLCALKKTWQEVETNHALLHTTAGCINWAEINSGEVANANKA